MASRGEVPVNSVASSSRLPMHPAFAQAFARHDPTTDRPPRETDNSLLDYPRKLASYCPDGDISSWWLSALTVIYGRNQQLSFDGLDLHNGRLSLLEITSNERLAEVLQMQPEVRIMFLGSGNPSSYEPRHVNLPALLKLFTHYEVSPHFIATVRIEIEGQPFGSVGAGVHSRVIFSKDCPGAVQAYHLWYSLPLRRTRKDPEATIDLVSVLLLERTRHAILAYDRCLYGIYNHIDKSTTTLFHSSPLDDDPRIDFLECFAYSDRLQLKDDPFGLQLLHITSAIDQWRLVLMHASMEISALEKEALTADEVSGLPLTALTHALHNLMIHIVRWKTEIQLTLEIVDGLRREHNRFYGMVLRIPDELDRSQVYHRVQDNLRNSTQTLTSNLLEVNEFQGRVNNLITLMLHTVDIRSGHKLKDLNTDIAKSSEIMRRIAERGREDNAIMAEIAKDTKKDSTIMKTIAILTMMYVPASFVTSIFGMQLIKVVGDHGHETLALAKPWPIFIVLIITLTVGTYAVWAVSMRWTQRARRKVT